MVLLMQFDLHFILQIKLHMPCDRNVPKMRHDENFHFLLNIVVKSVKTVITENVSFQHFAFHSNIINHLF